MCVDKSGEKDERGRGEREGEGPSDRPEQPVRLSGPLSISGQDLKDIIAFAWRSETVNRCPSHWLQLREVGVT